MLADDCIPVQQQESNLLSDFTHFPSCRGAMFIQLTSPNLNSFQRVGHDRATLRCALMHTRISLFHLRTFETSTCPSSIAVVYKQWRKIACCKHTRLLLPSTNTRHSTPTLNLLHGVSHVHVLSQYLHRSQHLSTKNDFNHAPNTRQAASHLPDATFSRHPST